MTVAMREIALNGRWPMVVPEHRAARVQWTTPPYWEPERLASMAENIGPGDLVVDIGAEQGEFGALAALWGADVVLIEPGPAVWPNIRAVFEANGLTEKVAAWFVGFASDKTVLTPPQKAVADQPQGAWPRCAYGPVIGEHNFRTIVERSHDTPQVTLDDFMAERGLHPTVLTSDIEGAEMRMLKGAKRILAEDRPLVYVSVHPDFMPQYGDTADQLHAYMRDAGYLGELLAIDHEHHWRFDPAETV